MSWGGVNTDPLPERTRRHPFAVGPSAPPFVRTSLGERPANGQPMDGGRGTDPRPKLHVEGRLIRSCPNREPRMTPNAAPDRRPPNTFPGHNGISIDEGRTTVPPICQGDLLNERRDSPCRPPVWRNAGKEISPLAGGGGDCWPIPRPASPLGFGEQRNTLRWKPIKKEKPETKNREITFHRTSVGRGFFSFD